MSEYLTPEDLRLAAGHLCVESFQLRDNAYSARREKIIYKLVRDFRFDFTLFDFLPEADAVFSLTCFCSCRRRMHYIVSLACVAQLGKDVVFDYSYSSLAFQRPNPNKPLQLSPSLALDLCYSKINERIKVINQHGAFFDETLTQPVA